MVGMFPFVLTTLVFVIRWPNAQCCFDANNLGLTTVPTGIPLNERCINLGNNDFVTVPNCGFCSFTTLTVLSLSTNVISSIHPMAFTGTALNNLKIQHNQLTSVPNLTAVGNTLEWLYLGDNLITGIQTVKGLSVLKNIDLSSNALGQFPDLTDSGSTLRYLSLYATGLTEISAGNLSYFQALQNLVLNGNHLTQFPDFSLMPAAATLEALLLADNEISILIASQLAPLSSLRTLDLNGNLLTMLPVMGVIGTSLDSFSVKWNAISFVPSDIFNGVVGLRVFEIEGNPVSNLQSLMSISSSIEILNARQTNLPHLTTPNVLLFFQGKTQLRILDLSQNQQVSLPDLYHFIPSSSLERIILEASPLDCSCRLVWMKEVEDIIDIQLDQKPCASPPHLIDREWSSITTQELCPLREPFILLLLLLHSI